MSGPKYSYARVDTERLKKQIAEMEARVESTKCENIKRKISEISNKTKNVIFGSGVDYYGVFIGKATQIVPDSKCLRYLSEIFDKYLKLKTMEPVIKGNSNELLNIQQQYESRNKAIENSISLLKTYKKYVENECNKTLTNQKEQEYINANWDGVVENISIVPERLLREYNNLLSEILYYKDFENIKKEIDSIINNHSVDDAYKLKQITLRIEAVKIEKDASVDVIEYLMLKNDYISLCEILNKTVETVPVEIDELRNRVADLENELKELTMMQYVSESLKTSMENLGYDIIGHEEIKTHNQSINKDYYDFTSNSVVNVSTSKNGAVLFEIMGKHSDLGDEQKNDIKNDMERFCPDYNDVKVELGKYGITLEKENLYPADVKYVRGGDIDVATTTSSVRRKNNKKELGMINNE